MEEDDSMDDADDEGNLKMAVGATNTKKKMIYSRKIFAVVSVIFLIYAIGNMTLFITPGVREFVQQFKIFLYLCVPLPIISKILISGVERVSHPPKLHLIIPVFLVHLLAIFLSATTLSLTFDTELVYFSCFIIFMNTGQLVFYTLQNYLVLTPLKMLILLIATSSLNSIFLQILLSIFVFPYFEVVTLSTIISFYIHFNNAFFMNHLSSCDWPVATVWIFSRVPV